MSLPLELKGYPHIRRLVETVLRIWPEHEGYCRARFADDDEAFLGRTDEVAAKALSAFTADAETYARDYRWMCEQFLQEELHFRRHGSYRLARFADANREVYADAAYMQRYVRGILISQILWSPHAHAIDLFRTQFLPALEPGCDYLEVGPGHGLFLYFASHAPAIARIEAWDVSEQSVQEARGTLQRLGVSRPVGVRVQDVRAGQAPSKRFGAAVISEVLEHLEQPAQALATLRAALVSGGRIFINAPINSPAPDHIYLWRSPDALRALVRQAGFEIEHEALLPLTGNSLERCLRKQLSVSCVFVARALH